MMEDGKEPVYASKAKPWLKYYEEKYIHQSVPECSAFALVCRNNERHLGDTALEYYGRKFTYADLIVNVKKTAAALRGAGVKKGDIITVVCQDYLCNAVLFQIQQAAYTFTGKFFIISNQ